MSERRQSIEKALKVLRSNVLPLNSYKAVVPHPSYYPWVYCWDTALHVMALSYVDAELAKENVDALLSFQRADGMIPNAPTSKDDQDMRSQPPLIVHAVRRYVEVTGDYQSARRWFEGLLKYHMWWRRVGVHPEAPHALASPFTGTRVETDLTAYWAVCSTGMDNHAVYDKTEGRLLLHNNYYYLPMEDLLINSMLAESARSLVTIAEWVGRMDEVDAMSEEYRIISRKVEQFMWDEESGFYYPCSFKEKRIAVKSCQTFAPLLAGISSHDRAERVISHMTSEKEFWTPFGPTSISKSDPKFMTPQPPWLFSRDPVYWRGPIWAPVVYMAYTGLAAYGRKEAAEKLVESWTELVARTGFYEYYYPDGSPGIKRLKGFSWTAAAAIILLEEAG